MERNFYKVPKRQWRKWTEAGRGTFNEVHRTLLRSQSVINAHPSVMPNRKLPRPAWKGLAWNAAWIAADHASAATR